MSDQTEPINKVSMNRWLSRRFGELAFAIEIHKRHGLIISHSPYSFAVLYKGDSYLLWENFHGDMDFSFPRINFLDLRKWLLPVRCISLVSIS